MALKNLFDMVKADRYTADGREAIIKAQEAETEDKVYQIGEISQKTGLQKTANGWVKPKNGKQPGAKKQEKKGAGIPQATTETFVGKTYKDFVESATPSGYKPTKNTDNPDGSSTTVFEKEGKQLKVDFDKSGKITKVTPGESKPAAESKPDTAKEIAEHREAAQYYKRKARSFSETDPSYSTYMKKAEEYENKAKELEGSKPAETKTYKSSDIERVDKNNLKLGEVSATKNRDNTWTIKNAKGQEVAQALRMEDVKEAMVKSANRKPGDTKFPNVSKEQKIETLANHYRERYGKTTEEWAKTLKEVPEETLEDRYEEYAKKHPTDSAPRVLTGDTRIRVRKA